MWLRYFFITIIFYFFIVLQNSFFVHFSRFGVVPNLVFIFFILLVFFERQKTNYAIIFYAITAGLFLDIFSSSYFGLSAILLIVIGFLMKKIHSLLSERNDKYSFIYFFSFFLVSLGVYGFFWAIYIHFLDFSGSLIDFNQRSAFNVVSNLFFASVIFWIYKSFFVNRFNSGQFSL